MSEPRHVAIAALAFLGGPLAAQGAKDVALPVAPSSPAFTLLGVEPAAVPRPGNVVDLAISVLSATDRLSVLPEDYALEVAPFWLFGGRDVTYADYAKGGAGLGVLAQTLTVSIATSSSGETTPDTSATSLGVGLRFSLVRGPIDTAADRYGYRLDSLYTLLEALAGRVNRSFADRVSADSLIQALRPRAQAGDAQAVARIRARQAEIASEIEREMKDLEKSREEAARIRELAGGLEVRRTGWAIDMAGGAVFDFQQRAFDRGELGRWGLWLTGGHEGSRVTALGVARFLADDRDADRNTLDLGGRLLYDASPRLSVSAEALARLFPGSDTLDTQYRAAIVTEIALGRNQAVEVSFGRDFDGKRSGSLIAAVSLVLGFVWQQAMEKLEP